MKFQPEHPLVYNPMVEEANIYDLSWGVILSDSVLKNYLDMITRFAKARSDNLLHQYADWLLSQFPELSYAGKIPNPWKWRDLVKDAQNIGSCDKARAVCKERLAEEVEVAYWTGGLEFVWSQQAAADFLLRRDSYLLLGIEPVCYPSEFGKGRGTIGTDESVQISFWSKYLKEKGFIFVVPRPLPSGPQQINGFYDGLYTQITEKKAKIVLSEKDPFREQKLRRGPVIEVPTFDYPSTTDLFGR